MTPRATCVRSIFNRHLMRRAGGTGGMSLWLVPLGFAAVMTLAACSSVSGPEIEPETPRQMEIAGRVKQALVGSEQVDGAAVLVSVNGNVIELSGFVSSAQEKRRARSIASEAFPAMEIDNRLDVK